MMASASLAQEICASNASVRTIDDIKWEVTSPVFSLGPYSRQWQPALIPD